MRSRQILVACSIFIGAVGSSSACSRAQQLAPESPNTAVVIAQPSTPYYSHYYSVYHRRKTFVIEGPGDNNYVDRPRWVSSKAAFGWNAVLPNAYTQLVLRTRGRPILAN